MENKEVVNELNSILGEIDNLALKGQGACWRPDKP